MTFRSFFYLLKNLSPSEYRFVIFAADDKIKAGGFCVMKIDVQKITSQQDGLELEVAVVKPQSPAVGVVVFSHGMAEHKERYFDFIKYLSQHGFACVIHDHRGHGQSVKSESDLGYFYTQNINYIVDDLHQVVGFAKSLFPNLPIMLFSHSMGTLVSRCYLKKYDGEIDKLVLCGPPTENKMAGLAICIAHLLQLFHGKKHANKMLNKLTFGSYNKGLEAENAWICANEETVKKYNEDKLCGFIFTTNGFINLFKLMKQAFNKKGWSVAHADLPIYVIAGEEDPVIQNQKAFDGLVKFLRDRGYNDINSKLYVGMRHELLNEIDNAKVYSDVLKFLVK